MAQRVFGLDTSSAANGSSPNQTAWNNAFNDADGDGIAYKFAIVRSSRGGLTVANGFVDDTQFYDNITRATAAGMLAGSYHYNRADLWDPITSTGDSGVEDATHYLNHAGMYMKPGYLLPVFDLEAGNTQNTQAQLTSWSLDWINTIHNATGIYPIVYTNSSYNNDEVSAALAFTNTASSPHTGNLTYQWLARPAGSLTTGDPGQATGYPDPYGAWDPDFTSKTVSTDPAIKPWVFWQNGNGSPNGFLIDNDAANGNIEFVKDFLVPALWTNGGSGDWGTTSNWNSDNPGYVAGDTATGPAPRLPNNQSLDWVKLQNTGGGTVTISSGARTVRKFYTQQPLNITAGSLTVGYVPGSGGKWDVPSEFKAAVTISTGAAYTAHTTQVDGGGGQFNITGGTITFREIQLVADASNAGKIVMGGDATFAPYGGAGTSIIRSTGTGAAVGTLSLGSANRVFTVNNGSAGIDLAIQTAVTGTGGLVKAGAGTLQLAGLNSYSGGTTVSSGNLLITKDANLGAPPGSLQAANITLDGGTLKTGSEITNAILTNVGSGYTSFPTASFSGAGADSATPSANVFGKISSIQVTAGGSGYTGTAKVVIVGGGGTGATATATMNAGAVSAITINNQGSGYTSVPTIYITDGSGQGVAGAGAVAVVNGVTLTGIALNSSGFDYASPTMTLSGGGGTGATASATSVTGLTLSSNRGITLTANGGTLYQTAGTTLTLGGLISSTGSGTLTKSGPGTLVLSGANTYTGATNISSGVLRIGAAERLPDSTAVMVSSGSALDLQGFDETIGSLAGSGNVTNAALLITGGDNSITTFSGTISGTSLRKIGTGKMTLAGMNTYSGTTTVWGGSLSGNFIGNQGVNSAFGTGNFAIANGAMLEYTGLNASTNRTISLGSGGGVVSVSDFVSLTVNGTVDGTALTKAGAGTLTLTSTNTYTGGTTVSDGLLRVSGSSAKLGTGDVTVQGTNPGAALFILSTVANAIDDAATLELFGGGNPGEADQGYANLATGVNEVIGSLLLNGVAEPHGLTYGSTASSALFQSDEYFSGAGVVTVGLAGDFNDDGAVDASDYVTWRLSPGTYGGDSAYDLWRANLGNTAPGSGASLGSGSAVPEPAAFVLVVSGLLLLVSFRRRVLRA